MIRGKLPGEADPVDNDFVVTTSVVPAKQRLVRVFAGSLSLLLDSMRFDQVGNLAEVNWNLSMGDPGQQLGPGMLIGLSYGLVALLWYGGFDVIKHLILRCILLFTGATPRQFARFLDYTHELVLLRRTGGSSFIFRHRLLLDHFASL